MKSKTAANLVGTQIKAQQRMAAERLILALLVTTASKLARIALDGVDGEVVLSEEDRDRAIGAVSILDNAVTNPFDVEAVLNTVDEIYALCKHGAVELQASVDELMGKVIQASLARQKLSGRK